MESSGIILKEFYAAIVDRDMAKARSYLADDMVYYGIFKDLPNADAYMAVFQSFMAFTTRLDVQVILSDGENAAADLEHGREFQSGPKGHDPPPARRRPCSYRAARTSSAWRRICRGRRATISASIWPPTICGPIAKRRCSALAPAIS